MSRFDAESALAEIRTSEKPTANAASPANPPRAAWPGSWHGWCAAFHHELGRLLAEGMDFDKAEEEALRLLPDAPPITRFVQ